MATRPVQYAIEFDVLVEGGQAHLVYEIAGRTFDDGRCNLDDAARKSRVSPEEVAMLPAERLCGFCHPATGSSG